MKFFQNSWLHRALAFAPVALALCTFSACAAPTVSPDTKSAAPAQLNWQPLGEPSSGGWVTSFQISPHDSKRVLMGGDMLGAGLSVDGGQSWGPTFGFSSWEINDFTWHPKKPNVVWAGTLMGPYLSTDGGKSWKSKRNGFPPQVSFGYSAPVERVLFDPNDDKHLITFGGSSRGWDLPGQKPLFGAIWESRDAGESWTKIATMGGDGNATDAAKGFNIYAMSFAAKSSTRLYAGAINNGFFVSDDGGKTWRKSVAGLPNRDVRRVIAHPTQRDTVFLALANLWDGKDAQKIPGGVYKSVDGGQSWTSISNGLARVAGYDLDRTSRYESLAISPQNPDVMYTADTAWDTGIVYVTRDGGKKWRAAATKSNIGHAQSDAQKGLQNVTTFYPGGLSGTFFAVDPKNPDVAWNVGAEHLIATRDGGKNWRDAGNVKTASGWHGRGFSGLCSINVRFDPNKKDRVLLQAMDSGRAWVSTDRMQTWNYAQDLGNPWPWGGGKDASFAKDGSIYITTGQIGAFFGIGVSRDSGATWKVNWGASHGLPEKDWGHGDNEPDGVHVLPNDAQKAWAIVGRKLYATTDGGEQWKPVAHDDKLGWFVGDIKAPNRFYVSGDKGVYATNDGTTFNNIGGPRMAGRITVDARNRVLVAAFEGERSGVWRYEPNTKIWTRLFDDYRTRNVAVDPKNADRIAVITNQNPYTELSQASGVWVSSDGGASWSQQNAGLAMLRGYAIAFDPFDSKTLVLGTFGRGFYKTQWPVTLSFKGTRRYTNTDDDTRFASLVGAPKDTPKVVAKAPTGNLLRNASMSEGEAVPNNWAERWGDATSARDTTVFKSAPASLRAEVSGKSGQAFQMIEPAVAGTYVVSGWVKTQGSAKVNVAVQSFDAEWKKNEFVQLKYLQADSDWTAFENEVVVPAWAARFNLQISLEGSGKAWLDDVKIVAKNAAKSAASAISSTRSGDANIEMTHVIREFKTASFDYPFGAWKSENLRSANGAVTIDATEAGGAGVVLNGANIAPQAQTHLALRVKLTVGNRAEKLSVNLVRADNSKQIVTFDLSKANANTFTTLVAPLGEGKFDSIQQLQIQGVNWSATSPLLKLQIEKIGTLSLKTEAKASP